MTTINKANSKIYSAFHDEPDMGELLQMFVDGLTDRVSTIQTAYKEHESAQLRIAVHQLKGAAGSYGFNSITERAREVETALDEQASSEAVLELLTELVDHCGRACSPGRDH